MKATLTPATIWVQFDAIWHNTASTPTKRTLEHLRLNASMTNASDPSNPVPHRRRTIRSAIVMRVFVYGGVGLALVWWFVDFRSIAQPHLSKQIPVVESTSADPGWPCLRGPNYNALSDERDLADSWPAEGPPLLWTREIGRGYSGIIAVGDRVYTQTQTLTEQKVVALDADTGRTVWEYAYGWPFDPGGMYPGPRATPTWSGGRLFFAAPDGLVGCLHAADGQLLWSVNVNQRFGGRGTDFGYSCSPLVEKGKVILPVGGLAAAVVALDAQSGATVWASGNAPASYCTALPITFGGNRQIVAFLQNELAGFNLHTGRLLWQQSYSSGYNEHAAYPLYDEPYLRTMQPFRAGSDLYVLEAVVTGTKAREDSSCQIRLVRHDPQMSNDVASSVLVNGHVYGFDLRAIQTNPSRPSRGTFRCMDFKTGEICWSSDAPGQATIVVADGKLLLFNEQGRVLLVRADSHCYEQLAQTEVFYGELCWTAPSLHHGRLYLRSPTRAACLYVGKPERMDRRQRERAVPTSAISKVDRMELGWLVGAERECPFELPDRRELMHWYVFSLGAMAVAGLLAGGVYGIFCLRGSRSPYLAAKIVLWTCLPLFGVVATPIGNHLSSQFVFTWPVALFAAHQITLVAISWEKQSERGSDTAWVGVVGVAILLLACLAYYDITRRLSIAPAWYFMLTFLAAWPLAVPAARRVVCRRSLLSDMVWMLLAFSLYYWVSGGLMLWRAAAQGW